MKQTLLWALCIASRIVFAACAASKKELLIFLLIIVSCTSAYSQCFYLSSSAGRNTFNACSEVYFMPKHDYVGNYTLLRQGVTKWLDLGIDITAATGMAQMGGYVFAGYRFNNWIGAGISVDPQFDLNNRFSFVRLNNTYILDGALIPSGKLWWASNTWHYIERNGDMSFTQIWYLGYDFTLKDEHTLTPAIDVMHSWRFDEPVDMGVVLCYGYKWFNAYAYICELLPDRHKDCLYMPCFGIGIDLFISTNNEKDK